jgi:hypothetical protein
MKINLGNGANFFWNPGILAKSIDATFREIVDDLGEEFKEVIEDKSAFPEFSGEDIIDTGELLKNQKLNIIKSGEANYEWGVPYAIYVHEGYTKKNGQRHPGRPWTQEAIRRYNNRKKI